MTNNPISRICLLIASADLKSGDLRKFARWCDDVGEEGLIRVLQHIRDSADAGVIEPRSQNPKRRPQGGSEPLGRHDEIIGKIESLLLADANLSKSEAAQLLFEELRKDNPAAYLPEPQKTAFSAWLRRVLQRSSESTVLHVATRLRNELVHSPHGLSDWKLRNSKS